MNGSTSEILFEQGALDLDRATVRHASGRVASLTPTETALLRYLVSCPSHAATDGELLREVWGFDARVNTRTLATTVYRVRRKLEVDPANPAILVRTRDGYRLTLPSAEPAASGLIGRGALLERVAALPDQVVTLVGPGGVGKTRLALALSARIEADQPGSVVSISLAGLPGTVDVIRVLSSALALQGDLGGPVVDAVVAALRRRGPCFVLLDDCERAASAVGSAIGGLASRLPDCRFLVTSRARTGLAAERVVPVPPLDAEDAVVLLRDRAGRIAGDWGSDEPGILLEIAECLDGLPLAIELAAARASILAPRALLARLDRRFEVLRNPAGEGRHQALSIVLQDSWDGLDPSSQRSLGRLTAFVAPFELSLAEAVVDHPDPMDCVHGLVDRSLVQVLEPGRMSLLESVRAWCHQALGPEVADEGTALLARALAARVRGIYEDNPYRIGAELQELRPHLETASTSPADPTDRAWCAAAEGWIARDVGGLPRALAHIRALVADPTLDDSLRLVLRVSLIHALPSAIPDEELAAVNDLATSLGDARHAALAECEALVREPIPPDPEPALQAVARLEAMGEEGLVPVALRAAGVRMLIAEDFERAVETLERAARSCRDAGLVRQGSLCAVNLAVARMMRGDLDTAVALLEEVIDGPASSIGPTVRPLARIQLGRALHWQGRLAESERATAAARRELRTVDLPHLSANAALDHGLVLADLGRCQEAHEAYQTGADVWRDRPGHWGPGIGAAYRARVDLMEGNPEAALERLEPWVDSEVSLVRTAAVGLVATARAISGEPEAALSLFRRVQADSDAPSQRIFRMVHALPMACVLHRQGELDESRALLERTEAQFRDDHHRLGLDACRIVRARLAGEAAPGDAQQSSYSRIPQQVLAATSTGS